MRFLRRTGDFAGMPRPALAVLDLNLPAAAARRSSANSRPARPAHHPRGGVHHLAGTGRHPAQLPTARQRLHRQAVRRRPVRRRDQACLKSCAPMTEVGCTGHQPRLAGTPRWRVSAASDPVKHVLACASVSEKFARNQESTQGLVLLTHSFACSFQRFTTAGGSSARSGRCACGTVPGKAGFHGFGPVVRRVSAVARRPAAQGRSGCPGRGPHRRAAGRPGRGRAAVSRPSARRR
jgi:hypothetical protein